MSLNFSSWFLPAFLSSIVFGVNIVIFKAIINKGLSPVLTTTYLFTFTTVILWTYLLATEKVIFPTNSTILGLLLISSLIGTFANLAIFNSFKLASNPGYVQAVGSLSALIAVIISIFVFKLNIGILGIIGSLLIGVGLILLARIA